MHANIGLIPIDTTTFVIDTNTTDTTQTNTTQTPPNLLYPNPATTELYYYNTTANNEAQANGEAQVNGEALEPRTCHIFNLQGQIIQQFTVSGNNITYIIDISQLASGTYVFKVINKNGSVFLTQRFVKVAP